MIKQATEIPRRKHLEHCSKRTIRSIQSCPVVDALNKSPHGGLWGVRCELREGLAILHGEVASFYFKQMAQEIAMKVPGVELVVNKLEVSSYE